MATCKTACCSHSQTGWVTVLGTSLLMMTLGATYSYGNMYPYLVSYIRAYSHPSSLTDTTALWAGAASTMMHGATSCLGGVISTKLRPRLTTLIGAMVMTLGFLLSWLAIKYSFYLVLVTYGFMVGIGGGIAYTPALEGVVKWFPLRKGLVAGLVVGGYGGGAFMTNLVMTGFINPHNLPPTLEVGEEMYFDPAVDSDMLARVPTVFLVLAALYAGLQIIGFMLIRNPPDPEAPLDVPDPDAIPVDYLRVAVIDGEPLPDECPNVPPSAMLRSPEFYILWFTLLFNTQSGFYVVNLYKAYGETFIDNDHLLAILGSGAALFNSFGRIMWGMLGDRFSYRVTMMCLCAAMMCWLVTLPASPFGGAPMFVIWICGIFGTYCGNFALLPVATAKAFGRKYMAINYGLIMTTLVVSAPIGAVLSGVITDYLGWTYLFMLPAGLSFISLLLTFFFKLRTSLGNEV